MKALKHINYIISFSDLKVFKNVYKKLPQLS